MLTPLNLDQVAGGFLAVVSALSVTATVLVMVAGHHLEQIRAQRRDRQMAARPGPRFASGVQPASEFTAGPTGPGLMFHDAVLAQVVEAWQRELGGGVR